MSPLYRYLIPALAVICIVCVATADKAPDDLRLVASKHYRIHTDLPPDLATDVAGRMDAMWEEYARRLGDFGLPRSDEKLEAYLYTRRADYMRLTGDRFPNTGGLFLPSKNLLAVFLETQGRDGIRRTLQHEAFHQFAFSAIGGDMPVWLNEGIAQVFEEGIWTGKEFLIGQVPPRRVCQLQADIKANRLTDFNSFLTMTDRQWASNLRDKPAATTQYNQAWAMAHFLIYATDESGQPKYRRRLIDMLSLIHNGRDSRSAFVEAFSNNIAGFQGLFIEWAHNLAPTAAAAYAEHQAILADMLISLGNQGLQFADIESFRRRLDEGGYRLHSANAGDTLPRMFFCDLSGNPLSAAQLFFASHPGAPAPDIICRPTENLQFRTRFLLTGDAMNYETLIESR